MLYTVTDIVIFAVAASAVKVLTEDITEPPSVFTDEAEEEPYTWLLFLRARTLILYVVFGVSPVIAFEAVVPSVVLKFVQVEPPSIE